MNGLRCPKCDLVNLLTAESCHRCGASLADLPSTAQVSVPVEQTFAAQQAQMSSRPPGGRIPRDNETGRKTFFWYKVYCGVIAAIYLAVAAFGLFMVFAGASFETRDPEEAIIIGAIYGFAGALFALVYIVAIFLPRRPYNWIVGIVMIALGLTSCCFLPAAIPLLIFWLKPETQAYMGK